MKEGYQVLMAKTNPEKEEEWLPLWMHLRDTAGVMKKLVARWLPGAVFSATGLEVGEFSKIAVFLAAIHDIGKATSYFQSIITRSCPSKRDDLSMNDFLIQQSYQTTTPHAWAGQWILQSNKTEFEIPESLSVIVGAHHGKPNSAWDRDLLEQYSSNFFGIDCSGARKTQEEQKLIQCWEVAWRALMDQALKIAGLKSEKELPEVNIEAQVLLSGLLIMADWIASNTTYFPLLSLDEYGRVEDYPGRINEGWKKLAFPEGWHCDTNQMEEALFEERFGFLPNEVQRELLKVVEEATEPGIFILEAQMGVGKTEAALGAAELLASKKQEGGIFFGLPTQATSNGIFHRLYEWGKKVSEGTGAAIRLAHGAAELQEAYHRLLMEGKSFVDNIKDDGDESFNHDRSKRNNRKIDEDIWEKDRALEVHPWFQGNKRALLADFVIGTVDQFLMASLRRKHFMLRHIGLAGKVVIIDECHAYDAYMNQYLERSLEWMAAYGVPVILLSATLPAGRRKELIERYVFAYSKYHLGKRKPDITYLRQDWKESRQYPLLTWSDGEIVGQKAIKQEVAEKRVKISHVRSISEMVEYLEKQLQDGGCACIITNTVKAAQQIYEECKEVMKDVTLLLYHAQFIQPDRSKKEQEVLKRMGKTSQDQDRNRLIVIGTQVLEQSLDYDADIMVTQLCPIDLLLQRMGRLHRHKRNKPEKGYSRPERLQIPECIILQEEEKLYDSGTQVVYGDYLLIRTAQVLKNEIILPTELPFLVQKVYHIEDELGLTGEEYECAKEKHEELLKEKRGKAEGYLLPEPPRRRNISRIIENAEGSSEKAAEASVRDSDGSLEILLMKRNEEGEIFFVDEDSNKVSNEESQFLSMFCIPDNRNGRKIASQRLRLPHVFTAFWIRAEMIRELEEKNKRELSIWQLSPWIRGELVLLLDQNNQAELGNYLLSYSYEKGLEYKRKEEENAGEGI